MSCEYSVARNEALAERLRVENPEQFNILVRMHLSFVLEQNIIQQSENEGENLKLNKLKNLKKHKKSISNRGSTEPGWGGTLNLAAQGFVYELMAYIGKEQHIQQEGVFRRTGSLVRQQELKTALLRSSSCLLLDNSFYSVHDCASVLKSFLADLSEPLVTYAHHGAFCQIADMLTSEGPSNLRILSSFQLLLLLIPSDNRTLLKELLGLLAKTCLFENKNKMTPDSLATLFTPHLLCPRNLGPEDLHNTSRYLTCITSYMIRNNKEVFIIPDTLAMDIRVYFEQRLMKTLSPDNNLNDSGLDTTSTANTVYSFVDREKTAQAAMSNPTEAALAQLYAHIQSLPESNKKKKLIKQFNKQNGQGTPLQFQVNQKSSRSKSLGDSIKRHIFNKGISTLNRTPKRATPNVLRQHNQTTNQKLHIVLPKTRLFQNCLHDSSADDNNDTLCKSTELLEKGPSSDRDVKQCDFLDYDPEVSSDDDILLTKGIHYMSEPNLSSLEPEEFNKNSCIKYHRLTPCENRIIKMQSNNHNTFKTKYNAGHNLRNVQYLSHDKKSIELKPHIRDSDSLAKNLANEIQNRFELNSLNSSHVMSAQNKCCVSSTPSKLTITPKISICSRSSISPISKSTQRMSKSMQESIMTPRSRKPLIMLSGTNLCNMAGSDSVINKKICSSVPEVDEISSETYIDNVDVNVGSFVSQYTTPLAKSKSEGDFPTLKKDRSNAGNECCDVCNNSLTSTFQDYLFSRSMFTASPVDASFSSQPGDFDSATEDNGISKNQLTDSLLFCLDGNIPDTSTTESLHHSSFFASRKRPAETSVLSSTLGSKKNVDNKMFIVNQSVNSMVFETSL